MNNFETLKDLREKAVGAAEQALNRKDVKAYEANMAEIKKFNVVMAGLETPEPKRGITNSLTVTGGEPAGSNGGYLVPDEVNEMVMERMKMLSPLSDLFNVEIVQRGKGWTAYDELSSEGLEFVDETVIPVNDGVQPIFAKVPYILKKYMLRFPVSDELMSDSKVKLHEYLASWFAKKQVFTENKLLKALLDTLTPVTLTSGSELEDLQEAIKDELNPVISMNSVILTNQSGFDLLDGMKRTDGRTFLLPDLKEGKPKAFRLYDVVVRPDEELPSREVELEGVYHPVFVGDYKAFGTLFKTADPGLMVSAEAGWSTGSTEARGVARIDVKAINAEEITVLKKEIFVAV